MNSKLKVIKIVTVSAVIFILLLIASLTINLVKLANLNATEARLKEQREANAAIIESNGDDIMHRESSEDMDWRAREYLNMKGRNEEAFTAKKNNEE